MKTLIAAVVLSASLITSAQAQTGLQAFAGNFGDMAVSVTAAGKLSLIDRDARVIYSANVKTGQETKIDHTFLYFSRSPIVLQYADYIKYLTVSGKLNAANEIDFVVKAHVGFDSDEVQAVVVFTAKSRVESQSYSNYGYNYTLTGIHSNLKLSHIEAPAGGSNSAAAAAYQFALTMLSKLYPAEGIESWLTNWYW